MNEKELIKYGNDFLRPDKDDRAGFFSLPENKRILVVDFLKILKLLDQEGNLIRVNEKGLKASKLGLKKYLKRKDQNENLNRYGFYVSVVALVISIFFNIYLIIFCK